MKKNIIIGTVILGLASTFSGCASKQGCDTEKTTQVKPIQKCEKQLPELPKGTPVLQYDKPLRISVIGQGVAPCNGACSPAQALALAKRAAIADAYRLIAEKVKGVYVEGDDYIKNMMIKKSTVRTHVAASLRNTNIVETTFKDGLCQVEMDIKLNYADIVR